jgi:hypothetical protein
VPTFTEQGLKDMVHSEWFALFLPPKASPELVARLNAAMKTALALEGRGRRPGHLRPGGHVVDAPPNWPT